MDVITGKSGLQGGIASFPRVNHNIPNTKCNHNPKTNPDITPKN